MYRFLLILLVFLLSFLALEHGCRYLGVTPFIHFNEKKRDDVMLDDELGWVMKPGSYTFRSPVRKYRLQKTIWNDGSRATYVM